MEPTLQDLFGPAGTPKVGPAMQQFLSHWQHDPDLAGVREKAALAQLPKGEREAWQKLWANVDALLDRARTPK